MATNECRNCGANIIDGGSYCSVCGAGVILDPLSVPLLLKDSFSNLIDWEEGTIRTFRDLLTSPSRVIRFYWDGGRKRYVEPLRYFFTAFIVYQLYIFLTDQSLFFLAFIEGFHTGSADASLTEAERERISLLMELSTVLFFVILPVMAVASNAAFSTLKRSYAEHIVLQSYLIAQVLLYSILFDAISSIPGMDIAGVLMGFIAMGAYVLYALARSFDIRLRTALGGMFLATLLGFVLLAMFFGGLSAVVL